MRRSSVIAVVQRVLVNYTYVFPATAMASSYGRCFFGALLYSIGWALFLKYGLASFNPIRNNCCCCSSDSVGSQEGRTVTEED